MARPTPVIHAVVELERQGKLIAVLTQNVDGLHLRAGTAPERLVEVHGNIREVECLQCHERAPMELALDRVRAGEDDPPCRTCGGILKSATISFGQSLVAADLERAPTRAGACDVLLAVGSTLGVFPIAGLVPSPSEPAPQVVIVNGAPTEMDRPGRRRAARLDQRPAPRCCWDSSEVPVDATGSASAGE